ncbi:MAG: agmatine deiminase family protein, partial [Candidatus Thermoplasmatota archaeon]|nr:agmatine deiminase family protein [Candidatus Thermoplasmatota archaeon]
MADHVPAQLGYCMPAEWEEHEATWLAWPRDPLTWVAGIEAAEDAFVEMVRALSPGERVEILVHDEGQHERVAQRLADEGISNTRLHTAGHVDSWIRDYGPTFLTSPRGAPLAGVDWRFNAWGEKYEGLLADDRLGAVILELAGAQAFRTGVVMEGGSFDVN